MVPLLSHKKRTSATQTFFSCNILLFLLSVRNDATGLLTGLIVTKPKYHIGCPFKESNVPFPAHPASAVLQANKLLLHFSPTARTDFVVFPHGYKSRLSAFSRKSIIPMTTMPSSFRQSLTLSFTTMIFLKESGIWTREFCSCSIFSRSGMANAD